MDGSSTGGKRIRQSAVTTIYDFTAHTLSGKEKSLADYKGKVLLIVNTASECGFTPQYTGLQKLHEKYKDRGLVVLGFPCNQFGQQEPGNAEQIGAFCQKNYGVRFPMFEKVDVNGDKAHPLFKWITAAAPGILGTQMIKWNFTKFLVDRDGKAVQRFAPKTRPEEIEPAIGKLLSA